MAELTQDDINEELLDAAERGDVTDTPSEELCFSDGKLKDDVLDACATNQFPALIGMPLVSSQSEQDHELFERIYRALPPRWQNESVGLHMALAKSGTEHAVAATPAPGRAMA